MSDKEEKRPRLEKMVDASEYKKKENSLTRALSVFLPEDVYDLKDYIINGIVMLQFRKSLKIIEIVLWTDLAKILTENSNTIF